MKNRQSIQMIKQFIVSSAFICALAGAVSAQTVKPSDADPSLAPGGSNFYSGMSGDMRPRFRTYAEREHRPSYRYDEDLRPGVILPESGYSFYDVPEEYGVGATRYTMINGMPVLVEPQSRRVIQVIE